MQNADGSVVLWDMGGTHIVNAGVVGNPGPTWHVKGTGVFFGGGNTAIIMQNDDGSVVLWDMSGTTIVNAGLVGAPGPTWHVKGTGDFFGDGNTDLVMQNDRRLSRAVGHERHHHCQRRSCGGPLGMAGQGHGRFLRRR